MSKSLSNINAKSYITDIKHIGKLNILNPSQKDWIETTMLKLRESANDYEILFSAYLTRRGIKFIHQAPFIFDGKIYFADFYIPDKNCIVEIDGNYHNGKEQSQYDKFRDRCFNGHKINVLRIPNNNVRDEYDLDIICASLLRDKQKTNLTNNPIDKIFQLIIEVLGQNLSNRVKRGFMISGVGGKYPIDICIRSRKLAIIVQKEYNSVKKKVKEDRRLKSIKDAGYKIVFISNKDANNDDFIKNFVQSIVKIIRDKSKGVV